MRIGSTNYYSNRTSVYLYLNDTKAQRRCKSKGPYSIKAVHNTGEYLVIFEFYWVPIYAYFWKSLNTKNPLIFFEVSGQISDADSTEANEASASKSRIRTL